MTFWKRLLPALLVLILLTLTSPAGAGEGGEPAPDSVGLTFDDGPDPRWTPVVLDILDEYGVKATFFVQGWKVDRYPEVARMIVERGHSIQPHGYDHIPFTQMSDENLARSLRMAVAAIYRATGVRSTCVRPPYGASSSRVERIANEVGLAVVIWDIDSADYAVQSSSGAFYHATRAQAGDNILAHDTWGSIWQFALPRVIEEFQSRGYGFDVVCKNVEPQPLHLRWAYPGFQII